MHPARRGGLVVAVAALTGVAIASAWVIRAQIGGASPATPRQPPSPLRLLAPGPTSIEWATNANSRAAGWTGQFVLREPLPEGPTTADVLRLPATTHEEADRLAAAFGLAPAVRYSGTWDAGRGHDLVITDDGRWQYRRTSRICTQGTTTDGNATETCTGELATTTSAGGGHDATAATREASELRRVAAPVIAAEDLDLARATVTTAGASITIDPRVGDLPTRGADTDVAIDAKGVIQWARGVFISGAVPETHAVIAARDAYLRMTTPPRPTVHNCLAAFEPPYASGAAYPSTAATDGTDNNPCLAAKPRDVGVSHALLGLTFQRLEGGSGALVPTWFFQMEVDPGTPMLVLATAAD